MYDLRIPLRATDVHLDETAKVKHVGFTIMQRLSILFGTPIFLTISNSRVFLNLLKTAGEISKFLLWQLDVFGETKFVYNKNALYSRLLRGINSDGGAIVLEFGAAHGHKTRLISKKTTVSQIKEIHSFDRFTGLPRSWRDMSLGAFDNQGKFPRIRDKRILWYKGNVEDTLQFLKIDKNSSQLLIIFDMDIYEPTNYVFESIKKYLKHGDLVYFDEAFDSDEFPVLEKLNKEFNIKNIGTTGMAIAVEIDSKKL